MRRIEAPTLMQCRPLAQLVEQLAFNQFVEGSNPSRPTTSKSFNVQVMNVEVNNSTTEYKV